MRKTILALLAMLIVLEVTARDLQTNDGKTYKNIKIRQEKPNGLEIIHSGGVAFISFENLPPDVQKEFNYSRDDASKYVNEQNVKKYGYLVKNYTSDLSQCLKEIKDKEAYLSRLEEDIKFSIDSYNKLVERYNKISDSTYITTSTSTTQTPEQYVRFCGGGSGLIDPSTSTTPETTVSNPLTSLKDLGSKLNTLGQDIDKKKKDYTENVKVYEELSRKQKELTLKLSEAQQVYANLTIRKEGSQDPKNFDKGYSCGTGFFITDDGYIVTNNHVVEKAKTIQVKTESALLEAKLVGKAEKTDLALLKISGKSTPISISNSKLAALGETIFTVGFPMPNLQGFSPKVTKGVVSSLKGFQDDIKEYQIDASVQPGNSGGPLADQYGNLIGIIVARIDDSYMIRNSGAIAQNVNYAIKKSCLTDFLDSYPELTDKLTIGKEDKGMEFEKAVEKVKKSTVMIVGY